MRLKTPLNWTTQWSYYFFNWKKRDPWLNRWKFWSHSQSHNKFQLHFYKQLLQNFTLDRNIMVHNTTNILGRDTTSVHIKTITADHDITNTEGNERKCTTNAESLDHSKCRSPWTMLSSVPKQKRAMSASNLLPLEDASSLLKTLLPRYPIVFGPP